MTWYMIFKASRVNDSLVLEAIDAIQCDCAADALAYAKRRYSTKGAETLRVEACIQQRHIKKAQALHKQHALDDQINTWTDSDLQEFFAIPTYPGNQDQYIRPH